MRTVSIDCAAELAQVSRRTIYNRIRDGRLQTVRVGVSQRVTIESLSRLPEWVMARYARALNTSGAHELTDRVR